MTALLLLALACGGPKTAPAPTPAPPEVEQTPTSAPNPDAPFALVGEPKLQGLTLRLTARYGGGCAEHAFRLEPTPRSAEAPATLVVYVRHNDGGDRCRAIVATEVDLSLEDILQDCTEAIEVRTPGTGDPSFTSYRLPLDPPRGCD